MENASVAEVKKGTRVLKVDVSGPVKKVSDEFGQTAEFDRVVFACPSNAVGNMLQGHSWVEDTLLRSTEYADDLDFFGGHMNASVHEDSSVLPAQVRTPTLEHAALTNKVRDLPVEQRPAMLITHGLYDHKSIDPKLNHRAENHARAHTIYSIPNMITMAMLHLIQGRRGVYFCSNYTVPGNCQDLSTMSGLAVASAIGAKYPFADNHLAKRDFDTIKMLMGL
eukprot:gene2688-2531_t